MSSVTQEYPVTKHPRLFVSLALLIAQLEKAFSAHPGAENLSVIDIHILAALGECDGQRASDLSRAVGRAPTSFTPTLDALVECGLLRREAHPGDRRAIKVYLTDTGRAAVDGAADAIAQIEAAFEARLPQYLPVRI